MLNGRNEDEIALAAPPSHARKDRQFFEMWLEGNSGGMFKPWKLNQNFLFHFEI